MDDGLGSVPVSTRPWSEQRGCYYPMPRLLRARQTLNCTLMVPSGFMVPDALPLNAAIPVAATAVTMLLSWRLTPMRQFLSITAFVVFLASSVSSIAEAGCKEHEYESECAEDPSCTWGKGTSKGAQLHCSVKKTYIGCGSHSEFYCEANGCRWDAEERKCTDKGAGLAPPSAAAQPGR